MCGIVGILNIGGQSVRLSEIERMRDSLAHRGPNAAGAVCDKGRVGLGHRRLAIFDLSDAGVQPMISPDGHHIIIFNGEIYNWPEIRKFLKNRKWSSRTDTETILHAYKERGIECLRLFNGMFAFAVWDKCKKRLILVRDRIGIKPLYYGMHKGRLYFGSEIKAFFAAGFPKIPDYEAIYDFVRRGLIDHDNKTFFKGIVSLEAAHYLIIDADGSQSKRCYWDLAKIVLGSSEISMRDAIQEYKKLLKDSIRLCMRSDVPVGLFLSGGVDSSILASGIAKYSGIKRLESYTYEFDTPGFGEWIYAKEVADLLQFKSNVSVLRYKDVPEYLIKVLRSQEMPVTSFRVLAAYKLYEEYKEGPTVILEGHGGDHVGAGFEYYVMPYIMDCIRDEKTTEAFSLWNSIMDTYAIPQDIRYQKLFNYLVAALSVGTCTQDGTPFVRLNCLSRDFVHVHKARKIEFTRPFNSHLLNAQYIDLYYHNLPRVLRYTDRASMAVGREARLPMLDYRIVELGFRASEEARIHNNEQRYFMRQAMAKFLPGEILRKPKRSIVDPQRRWLQHELRGWVQDIFHSSSFGRRGIFDQKEVIREYKMYCSDKVPVTAFHIFQYINVELWFKTIIDQ